MCKFNYLGPRRHTSLLGLELACRMRRVFQKFWRKKKSARQYARVVFISSLPDVPARPGDAIYIVGSAVAPKWATLECPCGTGHVLTVNLMKSQWPRWRIQFIGNTVTLSPSIIVTDDPCHSHFWINKNRVRWAFSFDDREH